MESKNRVCLRAKDINTCPHHDGSGHCLSPDDGCGMLQMSYTSHEKTRETKWYEKYYR